MVKSREAGHRTEMKKAIALLLLIFSELSGAMDGNTLLKACTDEDRPNDKVFCMGYVVAVADALNVGIGGSKACFPDGLTYGKLVDVAKKSLSERPEESRHYEAFGLVARALVESFPCTSTR